MATLFSNTTEMTNSATWNNVRSENVTDLSFDQLEEVLEYLNNAISKEEAEESNEALYIAIDEAIDAVANQWN